MNATGPKIAKSDEATGAEPEFLRVALDRYDSAWVREQENIEQGYEDLEFLSGEGQWDPDVKADRDATGRPCLTINRLPQYARQITGDIRQMRPAIKCVAVDDKGDPKLAEKRAGIIRYVENRSNASAIYFRGADAMVQGGRGAWEVTTEYAGDSTFEQEIRISPIEDPLAVLWDPDSILPGKVDAKFCFVPADLSRAAYKARFPNANGDAIGDITHRTFDGWYSEDYVRVAVYWLKVPIKRTLLVADGYIEDLTNADPDELAEARQAVAVASANGIKVSLEERDGEKVQRSVVSGSEVLEEPKDWPGQFIPVVDCPGEEIRIGRKVIRHGAVRFARDPQRMYNYYASAEAEVTALQPKAPFIGTRKNFEKFRTEWENANTENQPYLPFDPDPLNGGVAPQRQAPPVGSSGIAEGRARAAEDLQATTGIYNASLGAQGNETSGKAITARQREGDTGTYVYVENFAQAVGHTGRIINDLIPRIYDTTRTIRILGEDGQEELLEINKPKLAGPGDAVAMGGDGFDAIAGGGGEAPEPVDDYENDITVGAYDVVMTMGPSYNTKREEAREGMVAILQSSPEVAAGILDLIVDSQDWPNKDAVRERVEMLLPPHIQAAIAAKRGEPPPAAAAPPVDPNAELLAKAEALTAEAKLTDAQAKLIEAQLKLAAAQAGIALPGGPGAAPGGPEGAGGAPAAPPGPVGPPAAPEAVPAGPAGLAPDDQALIAELASMGVTPEMLESLGQP